MVDLPWFTMIYHDLYHDLPYDLYHDWYHDLLITITKGDKSTNHLPQIED